MASRWIDVAIPGSGLIDMGLDDSSRIRFAFNVIVTKEGSSEFDEEIAAALAAGGVTAGDIFLSSKAVLPDGGGPYLSVTITPGLPAIRIHNLITGPKYFRAGAFVMAVGENTGATRDLAWQALGLLTAVKDENVA